MEEKYTNIKERLLYFAKNQSIGIENFLENIGMTYGSFKGKAKEGSLNSNALVEIYTKYPEINIEWLLTGSGEMLRGTAFNSSDIHIDHHLDGSFSLVDAIQNEAKLFDDNQDPEILKNSNGNKYFVYPDGTIRIEVIKIPFNAHASYVECYNDEVVLKEEFSTITFKVDHIGRGNYVGFESSGDSMWNGGGYDTPSGADILGREVGKHLWINGFHNTKYGFIIIAKDGIWHKDIAILKENGKITLSSRNPTSKPFDYPLNDILQIFHVIKRSF